MLRRPNGVALLASLATLLVPNAAHAAPEPQGIICGFSVVVDRTSGRTIAEIDGGPLVLADPADPGTVHWGSMTCTIQTGPVPGTGRVLGSLTGSTTPGAVSVAGTVAFRRESFEDMYLCTRVDVEDGPTYYLDDQFTGDQTWTTDPANAQCSLAIDTGPDPEPDPWEPILCPVLALVLPPDGDVPPVLDCPPYDAA